MHIFMRDFSNSDIMLLHLKLQTCFVLPGFFSAIRSFQKIPLMLNEFEAVMYKHVYRIRQFQCIPNITNDRCFPSSRARAACGLHPDERIHPLDVPPRHLLPHALLQTYIISFSLYGYFLCSRTNCFFLS